MAEPDYREELERIVIVTARGVAELDENGTSSTQKMAAPVRFELTPSTPQICLRYQNIRGVRSSYNMSVSWIFIKQKPVVAYPGGRSTSALRDSCMQVRSKLNSQPAMS